MKCAECKNLCKVMAKPMQFECLVDGRLHWYTDTCDKVKTEEQRLSEMLNDAEKINAYTR